VKKNNNEMVIFDSRKAFLDPECDFFMRNVARATSAAPTFFPSAEFYNLVGSEFFSLLDGGVGKNDPTYFVFEEVKAIAENYGIPQKFSVISFGTGAFADPKVISQNAGVMEVKNLMNKILDTPAELDQAIFKEKYGNVKYRRFQAMLKFAKNQDISLDNIDAEVVKVYRDAAYSLAEEFLIENYGEFQNVSLVDWLAENAARKKELI
jgi:patatin-like phospholipase/acyl hydrolase